MNTEKISAGTVARFVLLLVALVNSGLTMTGHSPIPVDEAGVQDFISLVFIGATSLWAYWKDNKVTKTARTKGE